jgi:hypothetical protein
MKLSQGLLIPSTKPEGKNKKKAPRSQKRNKFRWKHCGLRRVSARVSWPFFFLSFFFLSFHAILALPIRDVLNKDVITATGVPFGPLPAPARADYPR